MSGYVRDDLRPGDVCPRSFAGDPENHVTAIVVDGLVVEGWGTCIVCGESVNIRRKRIPEHRVPGGER